jgi:hypothetical protein
MPYQRAIRYADRHGDRALMPVLVMSMSGLKRNIRPRQLVMTTGRLRSYGNYIWSGEDAENPDVRRARIRAGMKSLLLMAELEGLIG